MNDRMLYIALGFVTGGIIILVGVILMMAFKVV